MVYIFFLSIPFIVLPILMYIRIFMLMQKMQKSDISNVTVFECNKLDSKNKYSIIYDIHTNGKQQRQEIFQKNSRQIGETFECFLVEDKLSPTGVTMLPLEKLEEYQSSKKNILLLFSGFVFVLSLCFAINTIKSGFMNIALQLLTPITSLAMFAILLYNIQAILDKRTMVLGPSTIALNAKIIGNQRRLNKQTGKFLYHPIYEYEYKKEIKNYVDKNGFLAKQPKEKEVVLYYSPVRKQFAIQPNIKENVIAAIISGIVGLLLIVVFLLLLFI